jgi:hypothetical protein
MNDQEESYTWREQAQEDTRGQAKSRNAGEARQS